MNLTVVIPAKDEADRIGKTLDRLASSLATWPDGAEVVVVDDGSADGTFEAAESLLGTLPVPVRLLRHPENKGKGAAVRSGFMVSQGDVVGFTDADLAYAPEVFTAMAAAIADGADVVVGRRVTVARTSFARRVAHTASRWAVKATLSLPVSDTQCGIKLFRGDAGRALLAHGKADGFGFDPEILHIATRWGLNVVEVEAPLTAVSETSTVNLLRDGIRAFGDLLRARLRRVPPRPDQLSLR